MDALGKPAPISLLAAIVFFPLVLCSLAGCSDSSTGRFATYDKLKKTSDPHAAVAAKPPTTPAGATAEMQPPPLLPAGNAQKVPLVLATKPTTKSSPNKSGRGAPNNKDAKTPSTTTAAASIPQKPPVSGDATAAATASRKVQLLVSKRTFLPEGSERALRVTYDDLDLLKVLNMDPVTADAETLMPAWLKNLDGHRIRIRGFMFPTFQQSGIRAFALARDNQICCFGRNPKVYDVFDVALRGGVTTSYIANRPFDVVGVFHIRPEAEEGKLYRLYDMDDAVVIPK